MLTALAAQHGKGEEGLAPVVRCKGESTWKADHLHWVGFQPSVEVSWKWGWSFSSQKPAQVSHPVKQLSPPGRCCGWCDAGMLPLPAPAQTISKLSLLSKLHSSHRSPPEGVCILPYLAISAGQDSCMHAAPPDFHITLWSTQTTHRQTACWIQTTVQVGWGF